MTEAAKVKAATGGEDASGVRLCPWSVGLRPPVPPAGRTSRGCGPGAQRASRLASDAARASWGPEAGIAGAAGSNMVENDGRARQRRRTDAQLADTPENGVSRGPPGASSEELHDDQVRAPAHGAFDLAHGTAFGPDFPN